MRHMDLISQKSDDGSINLADPKILVAETSQKDNPHLSEAMKSDDREDFMRAIQKQFSTEDVWGIFP